MFVNLPKASLIQNHSSGIAGRFSQTDVCLIPPDFKEGRGIMVGTFNLKTYFKECQRLTLPQKTKNAQGTLSLKQAQQPNEPKAPGMIDDM